MNQENSAARIAFRSAALTNEFVVRSIGTHSPNGTHEPLEVVVPTRPLAEELYEKFAKDRFKPEMVQLVIRGVIVKVAGRKVALAVAIAA